MANKKVVCLGGGVGTANLIKGLKEYFNNIAVVLSMADDGGSSGRLRRMYNIPPPGDLVSCMAALIDKNSYIYKLLSYRFEGDRYGKDSDLPGHKLGNLMMVALRDITGNFEKAIEIFQKTFQVKGIFLPATSENVSISAKTIEGKKIYGETKIDLGKYEGKRILDKVFLEPQNAKANPEAIKRIKEADVIIAGPGDLYTTILPVLIIEELKNELKKSKAVKFFVVNVANKPFETKGYGVDDYINAVKRHLGFFPFDRVVVNSNFSIKIPRKYKYQYVSINNLNLNEGIKIVRGDIVDENFSIYHNSSKLAKEIIENIYSS